MAQTPANIVADYLRQVTSEEPSDAELLTRFATTNDGEGFALLLRRHGPMVLGVCRRGAGEWAEDAFQATFLALARAPWRVTESLPGWLHRVATRVSQRCARRRTQPLPVEPADANDLFAAVEWRELRAALDAELAALPSRLRTPLVMCYLDGLTRDEAAARLNLSLRTLHRRLDEGRRRLRDRLTRRGLAPVLLGATVLSAEGLRAAVPDALRQLTIDQATGSTAVTPTVEELLTRSGGIRGVLLKTLVTVSVLAGGFVAAIAGRETAAETPEPPTARVPAEGPATAPKLTAGKWVLYEAGIGSPRQKAMLTIREENGKSVVSAAEDDDIEWTVADLTINDRNVRFTLKRPGPITERFDGLFDAANPTRVLGSLMMSDSFSADLAVLELARPGRSTKRAEPPAEFRKLGEIFQESNQTFIAERTAQEKAGLSTLAAHEAATKAVRAKYRAEEIKIHRKLLAAQADNAYGHFAATSLLFWVDFAKPPTSEIESWVKAIRPFCARHGPQFEAATLGRFATWLIKYPEYIDLAHKFAAEADKLGAAPQAVKLVAEWDDERRAWASQAKAPAATDTWTVTITGKVTDTKGAPVTDASVQLQNYGWAKVTPKPGGPSSTTGPDGRYTITVSCQGTYRLHIKRVRVEKQGYVHKDNDGEQRLLPGQTATIDVVLTPGVPFGGTLKLLQNEDQRRFDMTYMLRVVGTGFQESIFIQNGKKFERDLPAGTYTVELQNGGKNLSWPGLKTGKTDYVFDEPPFKFTPETVGKAFDQMWKMLDRNYSHFALKPDVDWAKLRDEYRPKAVTAKSADELAVVLQEMLGKLRDAHVWIIKPNGQQLPTHRATWTYNGNRKVILDQLADTTECGQFAIVGKTKPDGFGYFLMTRQSAATPELVKKATDAIEKLADAPGFVIDLRNANGGNENFARQIAQLFCAKKVVYAISKYRNGSAHDDFDSGSPRELTAAKSGKPYVKPVVCLLGPGCVSSGEGFAQMMAALPHVTTVGLPTRGSSGNPGGVEVGDTGLTVYYSRWVDLLPDGTPIEGKGIPVSVKVEATPEAYKAADPTLAKALELLREKKK